MLPLLATYGLALLGTYLSGALGAQAPISTTDSNKVLGITPLRTPAAMPDFANAKSMELPRAASYSPDISRKDSVQVLPSLTGPASDLIIQSGGGSIGSGKKRPVRIAKPASAAQETSDMTLEEFGTSNLPFTTSRADLDPSPTNTEYPYRATGKLFFVIEGQTFVCSASLIDRGIVVTAAHCVASFGKKQYYSGWTFVPGYRDGVAPFGKWTVAKAFVLSAYADGTDRCQQGVVCEDDVAVLVLNPQADAAGVTHFAGDSTGWYAYGFRGAGFTTDGSTHITQLGFPQCLDNGSLMERNDAQGIVSTAALGNTVIGSLMCGGSSGGPWLINFGVPSALTGTSAGYASNSNVVIGVTSWGARDNKVKRAGASPFLPTNLPILRDEACGAYSNACK